MRPPPPPSRGSLRSWLLPLALPWAFAPVVARLIPSWYRGGIVALLLAIVAGFVAFVALTIRVARRARARGSGARWAVLLAAPLVAALWLALPLALLYHVDPRKNAFCARVYEPEVVGCPGNGPEIYYETWQCWLGNLEYRVFVRDSFLPFYREHEPGWYRYEKDLPRPEALCAELQGGVERH